MYICPVYPSFFIVIYIMSAKQHIIPFCKDCVHFISKKSLCAKFKQHDLVTGQVKYDTAYKARKHPGKCDTSGIHFDPLPKQNPYTHFGGGL